MPPTKTQSARRKPPFDSLAQEVYLGLWRTYDRLRLLEDELFAAWDLSPQQYNALRLLKAASPASMTTTDVARRLVSRSPDITRLLDKLHDRGLIARTRHSENRRVVEISLTLAGRSLLAEIAHPLRRCHQRQLGHLSAAQLRSLRRLLQAVRHPHEHENSSWK